MWLVVCVSCGGLWWSGVKVEFAPAAHLECAPAE